MNKVDIGDLAEIFVLNLMLGSGAAVCKYGVDAMRDTNVNAANEKISIACPSEIILPIGNKDKKTDLSNALELFYRISLDEPIEKDFSVYNFLIHEFIMRYYWKHCEENKPSEVRPHNPTEYLKFLKSKNAKEREFAEACILENKEWYSRNTVKFPGDCEHPGKYDFISFFEGEYSAIEVKANSARLSYWQKVRLCLLRDFGFTVKVYHVSIDTSSELVTDYSIDFCHDLENPIQVTDELFFEIIKFRAKHEVSEVGRRNFKKKYKSILI